jgi:hypothetical protein
VLLCAVLPPLARASSLKERVAPPVELTLRLSLVQTTPLSSNPRLRNGALLWAALRSSEEYAEIAGSTQVHIVSPERSADGGGHSSVYAGTGTS